MFGKKDNKKAEAPEVKTEEVKVEEVKTEENPPVDEPIVTEPAIEAPVVDPVPEGETEVLMLNNISGRRRGDVASFAPEFIKRMQKDVDYTYDLDFLKK